MRYDDIFSLERVVNLSIWLGIAGSMFATPIIRNWMNGDYSRKKGDRELTQNEREFLSGLETHENEFLFDKTLASALPYSSNELMAFNMKNRHRIRLTLGGYKTLKKSQEEVSPGVVDRLRQYTQEYLQFRSSLRQPFSS